VRTWVAGLSAIAIAAASFVGLSATVASAATTSVTLTVTSGSFGVQGNAPATLPPPGSITGQVSSTTGAITGATLTLSPYHATNTGSTETIFLTQLTPGAATGTIDATGNVSFTDTLSVLLTIHSPVTSHCLAKPIHVVLTSAAPYDTSTHSVTVSESDFTIPTFPTTSSAGNCGIATNTVNARFSGSVGNVMTLSLHGTLPEPPPPGVPTTTDLTIVTPGPVLVGTPVTMQASVRAPGGALATAATGTMKFMSGTTQVGATEAVVGGVASVTTSTLPVGTALQLTAVYSGNPTYARSTSSPVTYEVNAKPTVSVTPATISAVKGTTPATFTVKATDPANGQAWSSLWVNLRFNGIVAVSPSEVSLAYENTTGTWCPITLTGVEKLTGTFKGLTGACSSASSFSLTPGHSLTIPLRVSYTTASNVGTQRFTAALETVSGGAPVAPFTGATEFTIPTTSPYAQTAIHVNPVTKYNVTVTTNLVASTHQGYLLLPTTAIHLPTTTTITTTTATIYPPGPTGTVTYLVTGRTFTPPLTSGAAAITLEQISLPTSGLSVGSHTLTIEYTGDGVYNPASVTSPFAVSTPVSGTAFVCNNSTAHNITTSVVASGTLPAAASGGNATVTTLDVTVHFDPYSMNTVNPITPVPFQFSPGGSSSTPPPVTPTTADGTTSVSWTGLTASTIPITGAPGSEVPVGIQTVDFVRTGLTTLCQATAGPAHIGTVQVPGATLAVNPAGPVTAGTAVTLTATVYPTPMGSSPASHVTFFDGTTNVGTATVSNTGSTAGTASFTVTPAAGTHVFKATWSGTTTVPANTSNSVSLTDNPAPPVPPAPPAPPVTTTTIPVTGGGYHLVASNGSVYSYGNAPFYGSMGGQTLNQPIVGTATTPGDGGYWLVASDGGIFSFGNAAFYGSMGGKPLNQPIVGMASTFDGKGYWEVASDGGIFAFGDAQFYGSMGGKPINKPIVAIASTPDGKGYWEVASDGGIFAFGDAAFSGSTGSIALNKPIVGMASTNNGAGYWLVASDGGVFSFGNAGFHGTVAGTTSAQIVSLVPTGDNGGYWETASSGQVFQFGDATSAGTALTQTATIVAMSD
jgi:hypothetical protein